MIKFLGIFFFMVSISFGQNECLSGTIMDDLGMPIYNVTISNSSRNISVQSNCKGEFNIEGRKNDTLVFDKIGYFETTKGIKKRRKNKIILEFDYKSFITDLELNSNMSINISNGGQPLFIIDRIPVEKEIDYLDEDDVDKVIVFKGEKALKYFGVKYSRNGVVLIFTNCSYKSKSSK
jgi:bla regulator protein blaR1